MGAQLSILEDPSRRGHLAGGRDKKYSSHQCKPYYIQSCLIINESYALIIADKSKYTELLVFLRQKLHKG